MYAKVYGNVLSACQHSTDAFKICTLTPNHTYLFTHEPVAGIAVNVYYFFNKKSCNLNEIIKYLNNINFGIIRSKKKNTHFSRFCFFLLLNFAPTTSPLKKKCR